MNPLLLKDCRLVNVYSGEIHPADVLIEDGRVVSIAPGQPRSGRDVIDCAGRYAIPGLIEPHMHVDSTCLWPDELARVLVPLGTTTVVVDTTNVLHTGGPRAVRALVDAFRDLPLQAHFSIPSYAPVEPGRETTAYELRFDDLEDMLAWPESVSVGEAVSTKIVGGDPGFLSRVALALSRGLRASGHGNDLPPENDAALDAYAAAGIGDDHGARTPADVLGRIGRGIAAFVVESPGRYNLSARILDHLVREGTPLRSLHYCVDNITAQSILAGDHGYLDRSLRLAIQAGIPPVEAVRMGTLNPARYYRLERDIGSVSPGRRANIVLLDELDRFPPAMVLVDGRLVARDGALTGPPVKRRPPEDLLDSITLHDSVSPERLAITVGPGVTRVRARVASIADPNRAGNAAESAILPVIDGAVTTGDTDDVLKLCMIERYGRNGNVAVGFARGFGLRRGAMATSISLPSNNLVAVGTNDADIWAALHHVVTIGGGSAIVADGSVLADVSLPIGGIMSDEPYERVVARLENVDRVAREVLGCPLAVPFFALSAMVLHTAPDLGMTDRGVVDVAAGTFVPAIMEVMR
ncbi:adenine deaminase C-terminal domain-containing protein [Nonomuraea sp. NPDC050394]|uniref:adenine deaminase C-terminal domain-containing protein n=1 Tax=Nonomuraea sp. NPDC050394 TaxID=3364363 RepID=UPI00379C291A